MFGISIFLAKLFVIFLINCCNGSSAGIGSNLHDWNAVYETSNRHNVVKRFTSFFNPPNKMYQACLTPTGAKGHCKHIAHCSMPDLKHDFLKVFDYLCIIERSAIGICCADDLSNNPGPKFGSTNHAEETDLVGEESGRIVNKPEDRGCGLATKQFPKISGGRPAEPDEWPWMAAIIRRGYPNAYCGGALITDRHVLTAAHCTDQFLIEDIFVRLGEYDFQQYNETRARDFKAVSIRQHIDFDPSTYENDIAVIKLDRPTIFTTYIWPVCMPPLGETWEGWTGVVTGWGTMFFGGPHSNILMEVAVPIWDQEKCKRAFVHRISDTLLCAGSEEGGHDSCQGDSGGPLLIQLPNRRWTVVGIVSWGLRCGEKNHPGIYTRVNQYITWVIENALF